MVSLCPLGAYDALALALEGVIVSVIVSVYDYDHDHDHDHGHHHERERERERERGSAGRWWGILAVALLVAPAVARADATDPLAAPDQPPALTTPPAGSPSQPHGTSSTLPPVAGPGGPPTTAAPSETSENPSEGSPLPGTAVTSGSESERWERHLRGFRREHNFSLTVGGEAGTWHVKSFGALADREVASSGVWTKFQYTYHLPLYEGFGYLLGSSVGYLYESPHLHQGFGSAAATQFPGIIAGLVLNVSPVFRLSLAGDVYLERYNNLHEQTATEDQKISITATTYDAGLFLDFFYRLNWALRLEAHLRHVDYEAPLRDPSNGQSYPVDATLSKDDHWLGVGLVYHLL